MKNKPEILDLSYIEYGVTDLDVCIYGYFATHSRYNPQIIMKLFEEGKKYKRQQAFIIFCAILCLTLGILIDYKSEQTLFWLNISFALVCICTPIGLIILHPTPDAQKIYSDISSRFIFIQYHLALQKIPYTPNENIIVYDCKTNLNQVRQTEFSNAVTTLLHRIGNMAYSENSLETNNPKKVNKKRVILRLMIEYTKFFGLLHKDTGILTFKPEIQPN